MMTMNTCRCCKVATPAPRTICQLCMICDGVHGQRRHSHVIHNVRKHELNPYTALTMMALDDAWICGCCTVDEYGIIQITRTPKRWEVVLAWGRTSGVAPDLHTVIDAALTPYWGARGTADVVDRAQRDVLAAIKAFDPTLTGHEIFAEPEIINGKPTGGVIFRVNVRAPIATDTLHDSGADIPPDVMSRPRGSA